jgi:hypothetical protein
MGELDYDANQPLKIDDYNEFVIIVERWLKSHDRSKKGSF